jgi:hypothetical protein
MSTSLARPPTDEQPAVAPVRGPSRRPPIELEGAAHSPSAAELADPAGDELAAGPGLFRGVAYAIPYCAAFWAIAFVVVSLLT